MRAALAALLLCAAAPGALAADGAQAHALGYSADARYFAFEQYGTQDGSGYAYADIFVLDTLSNEWVKGTPVRVLDESEDGNIVKALSLAADRAAPVLRQYGIAPAYDTIAHTPFTEIVPDRRKVEFARYYDSTGNPSNYANTGSYRLEVKDVALPQPAGCDPSYGYTAVGMELVLTNLVSGQTVSVAKDSSIPKSRFCPHSYDLEAVYAPSAYGLKREPFVALIGVFAQGFEGSDRRIIAVPFELVE